MRTIFSTSLFVVIVGVLVEALLRGSGASPAAFAKPSEIVPALSQFLPGGRFGGDVLHTIWRGAVAFGFAVPYGVVFGVTIAKARSIREPLNFTLDFLRSIPATALVPLFLVMLGPNETGRIAAGIFSGALTIALSIVVGFKNLDHDRKVVADLIGLTGLRRVLLYELPECFPSLFVGIRSAVSLCLILVVVSEMLIGAENGLGRVIMDMRYSDDVPVVYGAIVLAGVIGYGANKIIGIAEYFVYRRLAVGVGV